MADRAITTLRLIDIQARMLLKADASKLRLGYLWWFLEPLAWVAVFFVVFNLILDSDRRGGLDFLAFLACGKFAFIWFSKTVVQASNSIVANQALVGKINVPKTLFPIAVVQESLYRQSAFRIFTCADLGLAGTHCTGLLPDDRCLLACGQLPGLPAEGFWQVHTPADDLPAFYLGRLLGRQGPGQP